MPLSTIGSNQITDGAIAVADVADGSITTAKIADDAVTNAKTDQTTLGTVEANKVVTADANGHVAFLDQGQIRFGTGGDVYITHTGSASQFVNQHVGDIQITNGANDRDVQIRSDDGSGSTSIYINCDGSTGEVQLNHYGTEKLKTTSTGIAVTGGIDFSANANVSGMTSELLDDYEEGTWVPAYTSSGGSLPTISYQTQQGSYTKIGRLVVATFSLGTDGLSSIGSASGDLRLSGLPFTHATGSVARSISHLMGGRFASDTPAQSIVSVNTSFAVLREQFDTTTQANDLDVTGQSNRNVIEGHVIYYTD